MKKAMIDKFIVVGVVLYLSMNISCGGAEEFSVRAELNKINMNKEQMNDDEILFVKQYKEIVDQINELEKEPEKNQAKIIALGNKKYDYLRKNSHSLQNRQLDELDQLSKKIETVLKKVDNVSFSEATGTRIFPTNGPITSPFGCRSHPVFGNTRCHDGIDIGAPYGQLILAADGGEVLYSSYLSGYGYTVIISHGNRLFTLYAHQNQQPPVVEGQMVKQGEVIGYVGSTGYSTGPHLHFEVRKDGKPVDPQEYVKF